MLWRYIAGEQLRRGNENTRCKINTSFDRVVNVFLFENFRTECECYNWYIPREMFWNDFEPNTVVTYTNDAIQFCFMCAAC